MVQDKELAKAVAAIPQRSEKQTDTQKLVEAFVDPGILPQVENINSQIIYGRRGTGKTHVLKVLESSLRTNKKICVLYIDARTFGSTSQFADLNVALPSRCTSLFRDLLGEVYNALLDFVVNLGGPDVDKALEEISLLGSVATEPVASIRQESASDKRTEKTSSKNDIKMKLALSAPSMEGAAGNEQAREQEAGSTYRFVYSDKVVFPSVSSSIKQY